MNSPVVVIPVYKNDMTELERVSLLQCLRVLERYPICIAAPRNLDLSSYFEFGYMTTVRFADRYFDSLESYSRLCMTHEFYEAFCEYDYMLIYQLDAFAFSDRLMEFCEKGYDFIGAPAPSSAWKGIPYNIGNGGFSLRKVSSFLRITSQMTGILNDFVSDFGDVINDDSIYNMEDCIFGYCGWRKDIDFNVPSLDEAFDFSIEFNINGIFKELSSHIPFGCHRWHTYRFNQWWELIKKYGYEIDGDTYSYYCSKYQWHEYRVLMEMLERDERINEVSDFVKDIIKSNNVRLRGGGKEGVRIAELIDRMELCVSVVYDKNNSLKQIYPSRKAIKSDNTPIIISSLRYDEEMAEELSCMGLCKGKEFFLWKDITASLCEHLGINEEGEVLR